MEMAIVQQWSGISGVQWRACKEEAFPAATRKTFGLCLASGGPSLASPTLGGPMDNGPPLDSSPLCLEWECLLSTASTVQLDSWTEKVDSV